ncbi:MAG: hypothetical protein RL038_80 [Actinomycetota bacterium]|jgi:hypothetical protein
MKFSTSALAAALVALLTAGLLAPTATALPTVPVFDTPAPVETEEVDETENPDTEAPTRGDTINLRKVFTSRSKSSIKSVRDLAPQNYPGYFKTAKYAKWYAERHIKHEYGWGKDGFKCLSTLWQKESSWRIAASGAGGLYLGIPQLNRPAVVKSGIPVATYRSSAELQVQLGAHYVKYRYGSPCKALKHKKAKGWY